MFEYESTPQTHTHKQSQKICTEINMYGTRWCCRCSKKKLDIKRPTAIEWGELNENDTWCHYRENT